MPGQLIEGRCSGMPGAKANTVSAKNAVTAKSTTAVTSGHWEYWCIYNEETGEFEIVAVWVEDEDI